MMKKISALIISFLALTLAACNTMKGVGQDVQKAGSVIENAGKK